MPLANLVTSAKKESRDNQKKVIKPNARILGQAICVAAL